MALCQKQYSPEEALVLLTENSKSDDTDSDDGDNEIIPEDAVDDEIDEENDDAVESDNKNVSSLCK